MVEINSCSRNSRIDFLIVLIVCFFSFFLNNRLIPADLMESRNLATAQEMISEGNYLVPTMNGELRFEKPPLPTWIASGIHQLFPDNLIAQRSMAGISATLMVIFLYLLVRRMTDRFVALFSALILATCFNVVMMARTATWDIYCHSFMLMAIWMLVRGWENQGRRWGDFVLSGFLMGLSFLSKGPVSFFALLVPFLVAYGVVFRPSLKEKVFPLVALVVVCLIVSLWWHAYLYIFHHDMASAVFGKESSSWINYNVRPWWYYWQFPAEAGIWALFFITSIVSFFACRKDEYRKQYRFYFLWFLISLVLLSAVPEKKPRYLLPILIPGSVCIGLYIYYAWKSLATRNQRTVFRINAAVIALILLVVPVAMYLLLFREGMMELWLLVLIGILSWSLCVYVCRSAFSRKGIKVVQVFSAVVLTMMMVTSLGMLPIGQMFLNLERRSVRELRDREELQELTFYYNHTEDIRIELVYEADRIIRPLDVSSQENFLDLVPFVFLTGQPADSLFAGMEKIAVDPIGIFDNNWRKQDHKRHNPGLVKEVVIVREKTRPEKMLLETEFLD